MQTLSNVGECLNDFAEEMSLLKENGMEYNNVKHWPTLCVIPQHVHL